MTILTRAGRAPARDTHRVLLYGQEGVGKSTWASEAPSPLYLASEDGLDGIDVPRLPIASLSEAHEAIAELATAQHSYQTVAIDTVDWLEPLVWRAVCEAHGVAHIEAVGGGYGKGYTLADGEWRRLLAALDKLRARGMWVVLLGHAQVVRVAPPEGGEWDAWEQRLHKRAAAVIREWCDAVGFARYRVSAEGKTRKRAVGQARVVSWEKSPAWYAKNRLGLSGADMPLSWGSFVDAIGAASKRGPELRDQIEALLPGVSAEMQAKVRGYCDGADARTLARALDRLRALAAPAQEDGNG